MNNDIHNYDDIINMPHHISKKHPQMSLYDRAAQFSSFAALVGHSDAIAETARLTQKKIDLSDEEKDRLAYKIQTILENCKKSNVSILHFVPDSKKTGGKYIETEGVIKKYNDIENEIIMIDNSRINIDDILNIESDNINFCE